MKKSDAQNLFQLVDSLEKSAEKLEEYYKKKDYDNFEKVRKNILEIQKRITEVTK